MTGLNRGEEVALHPYPDDLADSVKWVRWSAHPFNHLSRARVELASSRSDMEFVRLTTGPRGSSRSFWWPIGYLTRYIYAVEWEGP